MKKLFVCISLLAVTLHGCKTGSTGSPTGTVESFIEASKTGNLEEIKKYLSKSDVSLMEMGQSLLGNLDPAKAQEMKDKMTEKFKEKAKDANITVKDEKIDGTNATVNVSFTHEGKTDTRPFSLVKEDGQWKISLVSTGLNNSDASPQDKAEIMKNLNADSIQNLVSKGMKEGMKEMDKLDKDSLKQVVKDALKEVDKLDNDSLKKAIREKMKQLDKLKDLPKEN